MGASREAAKKAAYRIVADLRDRSGLGNEWDGIDFDIQKEILAKWKCIIEQEVSRAFGEVKDAGR